HHRGGVRHLSLPFLRAAVGRGILCTRAFVDDDGPVATGPLVSAAGGGVCVVLPVPHRHWSSTAERPGGEDRRRSPRGAGSGVVRRRAKAVPRAAANQSVSSKLKVQNKLQAQRPSSNGTQVARRAAIVLGTFDLELFWNFEL